MFLNFDLFIIALIRQMFQAFLFNIRNHLHTVSNIQRREEELNIILPRVNNFDIKQKMAWDICECLQGNVNFSPNTTFFFFKKNSTITYSITHYFNY